MGLYEDAIANVQRVVNGHKTKIEELRAGIEELNKTEAEANGQRLEALNKGDQKLYQAASFSLDSARTKREAMETELHRLQNDPVIDGAEASKLEASIVAALETEARKTTEKFIKMIDDFMPAYEETIKKIEAGNDLCRLVHHELLKDPNSLRLYAVTGQKGAGAQIYSQGTAAGHFIQQICSSEQYKAGGGKYPFTGNRF